MSKKADLSWSVDGLVHSFNYYRYEAPTAIENLPAPLVRDILGNNYIDTTIEDDKQYYWRIGAVRDGNEKISSESAFSTMDWLKQWILENVAVGDAWIVRDAVTNESNEVVSIPSFSNSEASMDVVSNTKPIKTGNYLNASQHRLRLADTRKERWKFLQERNRDKYICLALRFTDVESALYSLVSTARQSSSNIGFVLSADFRPEGSNQHTNAYGIFQCTVINASNPIGTSIYGSANNSATRGVDAVVEIIQRASTTDNVAGFYQNAVDLGQNMVSKQVRPVSTATPTDVLNLLADSSGTTNFKGRFDGALVSDTLPNDIDRSKIRKYFQDLMI